MKYANSVRFVLPRITAPAARSLATTAESRSGTEFCSATLPAVVGQAGDVEVVLDQHRDAVQRAADLAGGALEVEEAGVLQRARVDDPDGVEPGAARVDRRDPVDVGARGLDAGQLPGRHLRLQLGDGEAFEVQHRIGRARWRRQQQQSRDCDRQGQRLHDSLPRFWTRRVNSTRRVGAVSIARSCRDLHGVASPAARPARVAEQPCEQQPPPRAQTEGPQPVPAPRLQAPGASVVGQELARRCAQPSDLERADGLEHDRDEQQEEDRRRLGERGDARRTRARPCSRAGRRSCGPPGRCGGGCGGRRPGAGPAAPRPRTARRSRRADGRAGGRRRGC